MYARGKVDKLLSNLCTDWYYEF